MDRELLKQHLEVAERHVLKGASCVMRQRELVARLERNGHGTADAKALLHQFEELLAVFIQDRDRLRKELSADFLSERQLPDLVEPMKPWGDKHPWTQSNAGVRPNTIQPVPTND